MRWNFRTRTGHQRFMSPRPPSRMARALFRVLSHRARTASRPASSPAMGLLLAAALAWPATGCAAPEDRAPRSEDVRELAVAGATLQVHVVGVSDPRRVDALHAWIAQCVQAALTAYGRFPLRQARVRIEQSPSRSRSPVPWGQTSRHGDVAVLLYVREDASLTELREDWTAAHELAHLFHPYLGREGRWLAEGLASYYQNVLRARAGLLDEDEAWRRLDAGFGRGRREASGLPLRDLGRGRRGTMRVYWAGAAFWLEADLALRRGDSSLDAVLSQYARCCLRGTGETAPETFLADLDRIAGDDMFTRRYSRYAPSTGFPSLAAAYAALGLVPDAGELRFSDRPAARDLRRAVMGRRRAP